MSFKENLLKKIKIDELSKKAINSIGPPDSGIKIDKATMRALLEMRSVQCRRERDLELYILDPGEDSKRILVLDNELAIYKTTVEDVALRKSPTIKEMLSIRNAIKILKDSDVIVSKKTESIRTIQKESVEMLDLSFDENDLDLIVKDAEAALDRGIIEGIEESFLLFSELLDFTPPPKALEISNHKIIGKLAKNHLEEKIFGPVVIYSIIHNSLKLIDGKINTGRKEEIEFVHQVAAGKEKASMEGPDVFKFLRACVKTASFYKKYGIEGG
ncbi:hypothetical protein DRQ26_01200 [bacterium]|nr:MAG: hypothetical protein DRQ26_01200 [bacterium]